MSKDALTCACEGSIGDQRSAILLDVLGVRNLLEWTGCEVRYDRGVVNGVSPQECIHSARRTSELWSIEKELFSYRQMWSDLV